MQLCVYNVCQTNRVKKKNERRKKKMSKKPFISMMQHMIIMLLHRDWTAIYRCILFVWNFSINIFQWKKVFFPLVSFSFVIIPFYSSISIAIIISFNHKRNPPVSCSSSSITCAYVCVYVSSFDFSMYICRRHPRFIISGQLVNFISIAEAHTSSKTILTKNHLCFMSRSFYTHKNIFITLFIGINIMASHCLYLSFYIWIYYRYAMYQFRAFSFIHVVSKI